MKRLAVLSAATASLACAATASAYVSPDPFIEVSGNGLADGNFFSFAAVSPFDAHGAGHLLPPTGNIFVLGSDANGEHSFEGPVTCLTVDDLSGATTASVLFRITSKEREPAALYGVLVHVTDPEAQGNEHGVGDRIAYVNLNQNQYSRLTDVCTDDSAPLPTAPGRRLLTSGNITISRGTPALPFDVP